MYNKNSLKVVSYLAIVALLVSLYLLYIHFAPSHSEVCNLSDTVNCDVVNKSSYAELFNVPVSLWGAITFIGILFLSELIQRNKTYKFLNKKITPKTLYLTLIVILTFSIFFAIYLLYIEFYVLYALCMFCVVLDFLILEMFILSIKAQGGDKLAVKKTKKTTK